MKERGLGSDPSLLPTEAKSFDLLEGVGAAVAKREAKKLIGSMNHLVEYFSTQEGAITMKPYSPAKYYRNGRPLMYPIVNEGVHVLPAVSVIIGEEAVRIHIIAEYDKPGNGKDLGAIKNIAIEEIIQDPRDPYSTIGIPLFSLKALGVQGSQEPDMTTLPSLADIQRYSYLRDRLMKAYDRSALPRFNIAGELVRRR